MGEFEKDIRDMFVDLEVPIDTNELWRGIERKLDKKDKKYPLWWFLIPLILLHLITYTLYTQTKSSEKTNSKNTSIANNKNISRNKDNEKQIVLAKHDNKTKNAVLKESGIEKNEVKSAIVNSEKSAFVNNRIAKKNAIRNESTLKSIVLESNTYTPKSIVENTKVISNESKEKRLNLNIFRLNRRISSLLSNRVFELELIDFKPVPNKTRTKVKKKSTSWKKSIDIGIGFALVDKLLKEKDKNYLLYREKRESTEAYLEAINSNIALNFKNKSGFFISTGINYTLIDERFTSRDSAELVSSKNNAVVQEITESDGSKTTIRSQKDVVQFIQWDKVIYNYYHFIDIPVSIGYAFGNNKWNFEVSSGISYDIAFFKRGQIIGLDNYPVDISKDKALFKSSAGLNFISNMKVLYNSDKYTFYFEPNIKYNIQSITKKSNPLEQKYLIYGIKLGSRFRF